MTRRSVVFVLPDLGLGGAQVVALRLAALFRERGDNVVVATLGPTSVDHVAVPDGVRRFVVEPTDGQPGVRSKVAKNLRRRRSLRRLLDEVNPDVVVSFVDYANLFTLLATAGRRLPVVVSERVDPRQHQIGTLQRMLRRLLYRRASGLVVQTERVAEWGRRVVPSRRVHVIPNPVAIPAASVAETDPPTIVAAGRLVQQKGFDRLLDALAGLDAATLSRWRTVILGEGEERRSLEDRATDLGLGAHVSFPGRVASIDSWLAGSSLFVLSSRFEGFPNALTEAMAWGAAVIAFDCPTGPRELIDDHVNGRLVAGGDSAALTMAIAELVASADERRRLGAAARRSMQRYEPERVADQWDEVIEEVVHRVRNRRGH